MFLKAVVISALGGVISGRAIRNGWTAMLLLIALASAETAVAAIHHPRPLATDVGLFGVLDSVGSTAVLVGEALSV